MIWKNPLKRMKKKITTGHIDTVQKRWMDFGRAMGEFNAMLRANMTKTDNRKGKVGKLEYIRSWNRDFAQGNRKWLFRKFEKKPFEDANGFIKALEKRGFKRLGVGAFSTVLGKEGQSRVIKVIRRPDGWINYVHWAAQIGEAGHFAPKVFSYKKIKGAKATFAVAVVEKLEVTLSNTPGDHNLKVLPDILHRIKSNEIARKFTEMLAPGLSDFLLKLSEKWNTTVGDFDLHGGNLMLRADGTFVVVDPVSRGEDMFERLKEGDFGPSPASWIWVRQEKIYH